MKRKRESIPVLKAIELYDWRGTWQEPRTWEQVRRELPRADGSLFTYTAIVQAVRRYDRRPGR